MFKVVRVPINISKERIFYLTEKGSRSVGVDPADRIEVFRPNGEKVVGILNVVEEGFFLKDDEIGVSSYVFQEFKFEEGEKVKVAPSAPPRTLIYVKKKLSGEKIPEEGYMEIIKEIVSYKYSHIDLTYFVAASFTNGLSLSETYFLTKAMVENSERLEFDSEIVVDKHCIGGIPGNRTTMVVVPLVAAAGLVIPKTSSRSITSPAGTADVVETVANVCLDIPQIKEVVRKTNGCMVWGGALGLAPADDILIQVEKPLSIDSTEQMVASILSKKVTAGSTHVLIDIPIGKTAKVTNEEDAYLLKMTFLFVGERLGLNLKVVFTDGSQPIGRGIGPVLEVRDVIKILKNDPDVPQDLKEKSLFLAGQIYELAGIVGKDEGKNFARELLESGKAYEKFNEIVEAQGRHDIPPLGSIVYDVVAPVDGVVEEIDNSIVAKVAKLAGAPADKGAGVYLHKKVGDKVEKGEPIYTIYAEHDRKLSFAKDFINEYGTGYAWGDEG